MGRLGSGGDRGRGRAVLRAIALFVLPLVLFSSSFVAGFSYSWARLPEPVEGNPISLKVLWEAWRYVEQYYYGPTPAAVELTYGAIDGALEVLEDPYTRLVRPVASSLEQDTLRGRFGGIGAVVYQQDDGIYLRPLPDSSAEKAGLMEGDRILAVDGTPLPEGADVDTAVSRIRGPVDTEVAITVWRPATEEELTVRITRTELTQPTVEWRLIEGYEPTVGYVRIGLFGERTAEELQRALAALRAEGAQALILDLRGNPGGLLEAAVEVASRFLSGGVVLYEVHSDGSERTYTVRPRARADEPVVVLVDGGSASASEIVAGALQDRGRAQLVGTTTRGKGSVQLSYALSDGSALHVTSALWLTPERHEINGVGLTPDLVVEPDPEAQDGDPVLEAALAALGAAVVAADGGAR